MLRLALAVAFVGGGEGFAIFAPYLLAVLTVLAVRKLTRPQPALRPAIA